MASVLATTNLSQEQQECVNIIISSGSLLVTLLNDILDHSKIEAGKLELESIPFDICNVSFKENI